jgi:sugar transferase (PEP-CTERM/EpsH1 system associated)
MHVVYALRPGGMEFGVVKLVNGLDPARVRSGICSTKPAGQLKQFLASDVALFELQRRDGNDPGLIRDLYRLFRRERPDIVHTHAWGTLVEGLVAARLARVPFVIHGEHGTLQLRAHQRWVQRRAWASADQVLSVSSRLAERIARETGFPLSRIRTIRNGVDLSRFAHISREDARARLGIGGGGPLAVAVGRLVPVKDHMMLLEAMALLRRDDVDVTLAVAGDGPLQSALVERASTLGIGNCIRFLGHRDDVDVVLAAGDIFVLSSASEGLSNTILEAMAAGLPVIATRVGGADEMVEDGVTGLLVPPHSPQELASAMATVLRDAPHRRLMGSAGRARVEAEFSLFTMVRRYEQMYVELAMSRIAPRRSQSSESSVERLGAA